MKGTSHRAFRLLGGALVLAAVSIADAADLRIGATAGPYADQLKTGIKPFLEKLGHTVKIVEFNDYVQPNLALAQGAIQANVFQNPTYLKRFAGDHKLDLAGVVEVPTVPIGLYSKRHCGLGSVKPGASVSMPNDPTNQARSLHMLEEIGWIGLRREADPLRVSERDVESNPHRLKLIPLEAAQTARALADVDYAFVNGNYAIASGLKLDEAVVLEKTPPHYMIVVTVARKDVDQPWVRDLVAAYRSPEFRKLVETRYVGYVRPAASASSPAPATSPRSSGSRCSRTRRESSSAYGWAGSRS